MTRMSLAFYYQVPGTSTLVLVVVRTTVVATVKDGQQPK